jgi:GNAT superfamily N-acetyltransferase
MDVRKARLEDAEEACAVVRRSIAELCHADHQGDAATVSAWLANKTAENMRRWITQAFVFVATDGGRILGVGAMTAAGEIMLNYVSPDARLRGLSKALIRRLEQQAAELGVATMTLQSTLDGASLLRLGGLSWRRPADQGIRDHRGLPDDEDTVRGSRHRRAAKNSRNRPAASRSPMPPKTSGRWWQVAAAKNFTPLSTAPPLGSGAP